MDQKNLPATHIVTIMVMFLFLLEMIRLNNTFSFQLHAINEGMDMGIVNPSMLEIYDDVPKDLLIKVEDVLFNRT